MTKISVSVKKGQIPVNSVHLVRRGRNFWVFEADLVAKRSEVFDYYTEDAAGAVGVTLCKGPETLHARATKTPTEIVFKGFPKKGRIRALLEVSRYTLLVTVYVHPTKYNGQMLLYWDRTRA